MRKTKLFFLFGLFSFATLSAQNSCDLISVTPLYDCVDTTFNVQYGVGRHDYFFPDPVNGCAPLEPLFADVFQPCVSNTEPRPLVIFIHGGGFSAGNKADFWPTCQEFASRGYVAATIQYRLSMNALTLNRQDFIRAGFRAMQDAKVAIRFFRANANVYAVDTSNIFLIGYSAGAVTALNVVYSRDEEEKPVETGFDGACGYWFGCPFCPDLGTIEGEGGNSGFSSKVNGIYALAGAVMNMNLIDAHDDTPVYMIHGTADETVDYDSSCFLNLSPCPKLYGSHSIQQRAEELELCTFLHTIEGASHDLVTYLDTIVAEAASFFKGIICEGNPCTINTTEEEQATAPLLVYPNPSEYRVTVEFSTLQSDNELLLSNPQGNLMLRKSVLAGANRTELNLAPLPTGIYFLKLKNAGGIVKIIRK